MFSTTSEFKHLAFQLSKGHPLVEFPMKGFVDGNLIK